MRQKSRLYYGETGGTPLGKLLVAVSKNGLVAIQTGMNRGEFEGHLQKRLKCETEYAPERVKAAAAQLEEYLAGKRRTFTLPVDWTLFSEFKRLALQATFTIPYGETRTYKEITKQIGRPGAARAVGRAEATNPLPLVIPCHRVIGSDGKLHGYGMGEGLKTKEWLLKMEGAVMA